MGGIPRPHTRMYLRFSIVLMSKNVHEKKTDTCQGKNILDRCINEFKNITLAINFDLSRSYRAYAKFMSPHRNLIAHCEI